MSSLDRPLSGDVLVVDLRDDESSQAPEPRTRQARTLIKHDRLRVTLVTLAPGAALAEHRADGPITVQPIEGRLRFTAAGADHELAPGTLLTAGAGIPHAVASPGGARFLLTVAAPGEHRAPTAIGGRSNPKPAGPEAWLRGPVEDIPSVLMPAAHALIQARDDLHRAAAGLTPGELWVTPGGAASIGFHLRHVAGSLDRLLTYARDEPLTDAQRAALAGEGDPGTPPADAAALLAAVTEAVEAGLGVLRATPYETLLDVRHVGRSRAPSNLIGLLFHAAEHTQRHAGQVITTAAIVRGLGLGAG